MRFGQLLSLRIPDGDSRYSRPDLAVALVVLLLAATPVAAEIVLPAFKIQLELEGVYRVGFEDLRISDPLPSAGLGLSTGGTPVPVWVEDGGDGFFGDGDWLEFVGERLPGDHSYASEYTRHNVYFLRFDHERPSRMVAGTGDTGTRDESPSYRRRQHLEHDLLILRLPPPEDGEPEELWFWTKLVHNDKQPFVATLDLDDLDSVGGGAIDLRIHLRGWSNPRSKPDPEAGDHRVEVSLNGEAIGAAEWNGTRPYLLEIPGLAADRLVPGDNSLALKIPRRKGNAEGRPLIDVVMLNWIEIAYPRQRWIGDEQAHFSRAVSPQPGRSSSETGVPAQGVLRLESEPDREITLYGDRGSRTASDQRSAVKRGNRREHRFFPAPGETVFFAASPAQLFSPVAVVRDQPSRLADPANRADYIMIAHPTLREALTPLAEMHRSRGLDVTVVDIEDVYDEFSHGVVHPTAIKTFLRHANQHWQRPAPRWVLLVGDASWDAKNESAVDANYADWTYRPGETQRFSKNGSTPYAEDAALNRRGLIPTWNHSTSEGHSASDNYFVTVDDDDDLPDMAIGRLPVTEPEEVAHIVAKTVRYVTAPEVGPWRRSALFITNEDPWFQHQSDRLALEMAATGFAPEKVYPASSETSNEHHSRHLIETLDEGQLLVHFLGHGGRYIWQTGPPDLNKNHDLLTLDHLDDLAPTGRLPVVLSMTCYSAPFDHPSADSIGEKLLRLDNRGAIGVVAASWRNTPLPQWGQVLLEELTAPGATMGEAVTAAKRRIQTRVFVETYNLLGDPAVPVALPAAPLELQAAAHTVADATDSGLLHVRGTIGLPAFTGRVLVDLVDASGQTHSTVQLEVDGTGFSAEFEIESEALHAGLIVRAYAWDAAQGVDAAGALTVGTDVGSAAAVHTSAASR